jgi:NAD(P)-dependent dehydrogenase (short-subunit alcohol dehydrogenase family)
MSIVIITGAARGIGAACVQALTDRAPLLAVDLRGDRLEQTVYPLRRKGIEIDTFVADLTSPDAVAELAQRAEQAGGCSGLVHAAGLSPTMADARRIFEVNLFASARLVDALEPTLRPGAAGVLVASQAGTLMSAALARENESLFEGPFDHDADNDAYDEIVAACGAMAEQSAGAYGLSKRGVQLLAISRARSWGAHGARLVSLSPGIIDTEMGSAEFETFTESMQANMDCTPVGARRGRADEIASVAAFLLSDAASFVSGSDVLVDGGSTHQMLSGAS